MWLLLALVGVVVIIWFWGCDDLAFWSSEERPASNLPTDARSGPDLTSARTGASRAGSQSFCGEIAPGFIFISTLSIPLALLTVTIVLGRMPLDAYLVGIIVGIVLSAVCSALINRILKVKVDASGLHSHSSWGLRRFVRWDDLDVVGPISIWTLRYLRLVSRSSGKRVWLPLFLHTREDFRDSVAAYAPPDCPLLPYLSIEGPGSSTT